MNEHTQDVLDAVSVRLEGLAAEHGPLDYPHMFGESHNKRLIRNLDGWVAMNTARAEEGSITWDGIVIEAAYRAASEVDADERQTRLVNLAALAVAEVLALGSVVAEDDE